MKRFILAFIASGIAMASIAQEDSTAREKVDTIKIGGMIIIKKSGKNKEDNEVVISNNEPKKKSNLTTNWGIVDLGFANYHDETNYGSAEAQAFAPLGSKDKLELRSGKSVNVNIWFFMQRLNLIQHAVNLKYGLGLELNNYRFDDETIRLTKNPTIISTDASLAGARKNKLAADYVTIPMMLNFNLTPKKRKGGFGFSGGVSAGYLYSARQKIKMGDDKDKLHDNFDLRRWKISYIGELNMGPVRLYGSYALKSMWEKGLQQRPYNVGVRFSNW